MSTQIRTGVIRVEVGDNKPLYDTHVNAIISLALMLLVCYQRPTGIEPISTVSKTDALSVVLRTLLRGEDIYVSTNEETRTLMP